ncbi:pteridine reductase [Echinimonas agarilytica]|uniref:Pteridine reductase n=1 Tax=Echinimonas agarilytica TaxID=1215918 RepID=A0AA41W6Q9_9GAMM|nr:pteridine reductase [Echinimonas agarilytica]MCM2679483.1 pteridine reductase [Echinimonas agarilytica]
MSEHPVALITGAARRIGAEIARQCHDAGYCVVLHCRHSTVEADALCQQLNQQRDHSACVIQADLSIDTDIKSLAEQALKPWRRLDLLINNASSFYPTPLGTIDSKQWQDLFASNAYAPLMLSQALAPALQAQQGSIINLADIHAQRPLKQHTVYSMAKAANVTMTQSLAKEFAPHVRVNAVAPGAIIWPENSSEYEQQTRLKHIPLQRSGDPSDIAQACLFLASAPYITGQVLAVDGGASLN